MLISETNPKINSNDLSLLHRVAGDLNSRGKWGALAYPVFWLLIGSESGFSLEHSLIFWFSGLFFTAIAAVRIWSGFQFPSTEKEKLSTWIQLLYFSTLPQPFLWGVLFAYSLMIDNSIFAIFMAFSTAGIAAGGSNSFAPNRKFCYSFILVFLLPPLIISIFVTHVWLTVSMLGVYLAYLIGLSNSQRKEYWRALNNELKLAKQSRTDALTELDNRRFFDEKLKELCHLSSRNRENMAVLMIDCDHFKLINDNYGHEFGDQCLVLLSKVLTRSLSRVSDVCARYGGEEFSIILPGVDRSGAKVVCERIRTAIEGETVVSGKNSVQMTVSVGCVVYRAERYIENLPTQLFKQADKALYKAKNDGRNRCEIVDFSVSANDN